MHQFRAGICLNFQFPVILQIKPERKRLFMLRSYHLTHLTDTGKAEKILREMDGLEGVRSVSISEDLDRKSVV